LHVGAEGEIEADMTRRDRPRDIEQQEFATAEHRFQGHAKPEQTQHIQQDVKQIDPIVAERARDQPPHLAAYDLAGLQRQPLIDDRNPLRGPLGLKKFRWNIAVGGGDGRRFLSRRQLGGFWIGRSLVATVLLAETLVVLAIVGLHRRRQIVPGRLDVGLGRRAGEKDLQQKDDDIGRDQPFHHGREIIEAPAGDGAGVVPFARVVAVFEAHA
jgi:hypothetical protein